MAIRAPWDPKFDRGSATDGSPGSDSPGRVLHEARPTGLTYEKFYGLKEKPFSLSSDSRFFYHSRSHAPAFDDLLAGIRRRESLNVLTGDIGTGKTTLCRAVLQNLDRKTFSAFVPDPFVSREDLLKVVLMDFGVLSVDDLTSGRLKTASRTELSYLLYEFLGTLTPLQAFAVVIIDEAQNLSLPLLEEIRILADSDGRERQLQVVLVGQLELGQKLKLPEMRQVDQRVSVHCSLSPLGADGVAGYVAHRLQIAGGSPDRVRFSPEAIEVVYRVSGGVPRLINRICDRALHHGYLRRAGTIDGEMVEAAIPDAGQFASAPAAAPAPVPDMAPQDFNDPVDEWMTLMDEDVKATRLAAARRSVQSPHTADVARLDHLIPLPTAAAGDREHGPKLSPARPDRLIPAPAAADDRDQAPKAHPRVVPRTQKQKFTRRWARRLGIAALCTIGFPVAAIAGLSLWNLSTDMWELTVPLMVPPLPPVPLLSLAPAVELPPLPETLPPDAIDGPQ